MANLTVNGHTYAYPDPGSEIGWGEDATGWAADVTEVLDSLSSVGTINQTEVSILATATDQEIPGLLFSNTLVESAIVAYRILRTTDGGGAQLLSEFGELNLVYDPGTSDWLMSQVIKSGGESKVTLSVSSSGQVSYTSTALTGSNYSGYIKFKTITSLVV